MRDQVGQEPLQVNVVGLGYVGSAVCLAVRDSGHRVAGIDIDSVLVRALQVPNHRVHAERQPLQAAVAAGHLSVHDRFDDAPAASVWVVAVPTPLGPGGRPDTSAISSAARSIAGHLRPMSIVVLESTSYPGTTEEVLLPPLLKSGLTLGVDLFVGYSPERINPGTGGDMRRIPKLVAGCTDACRKAVADFYASVVAEVWPMSSTRAAEMAKLHENSWRLVNISFANEMEALCTSVGLDPWEIEAACRTKPFGYHSFEPGPGAGGHCIPVDSAYLSDYARRHLGEVQVLDSALATNRSRPAVVTTRVLATIEDRPPTDRPARVLLIGAAYKPNVADTRESPALTVMKLLTSQGLHVDYHDPHVPRLPAPNMDRQSVALTADSLASYDSLVVLTAHDAVDWQLVADAGVPVVDTRNALRTYGSGR